MDFGLIADNNMAALYNFTANSFYFSLQDLVLVPLYLQPAASLPSSSLTSSASFFPLFTFVRVPHQLSPFLCIQYYFPTLIESHAQMSQVYYHTIYPSLCSSNSFPLASSCLSQIFFNKLSFAFLHMSPNHCKLFCFAFSAIGVTLAPALMSAFLSMSHTVCPTTYLRHFITSHFHKCSAFTV